MGVGVGVTGCAASSVLLSGVYIERGVRGHKFGITTGVI